MDVSEMISLLDDHGFADTSTERKVEVLQDAIDDICAEEPWPFLEDATDVTLDSQTPTIPTDFQAAVAFVIPSQETVLIPERWEVMVKNYADLDTQTGVPYKYYFVGTDILVFPIPSGSYTAKLKYLKYHPEITASTVEADILIPAPFHRAIVFGALVNLFDMEDDNTNAQRFEARFERRKAKMKERIFRRQYDRPDRIFELDDDDIWEA